MKIEEKYCPINNEPLRDEEFFCRNHLRALKLLVTTYNSWDEAYEGLSWEEYLEKLTKIKESVGIWAQELIQYIIDNKINYADLKKIAKSE
ncbi:MAG: hypothetical protein KAR35_04045 [Candidatus Heimdallarchaeota archaeon]|nr:hypothetical protein [Candidatus Heimdallarchaeota archaeon]MCK5048527.1 hypothetical protein [Candidatus Heimdallarchaeota archaeon]